ncbi:DUF309 domain-containing protein [Halostagnicola bangensis]
MRESLRAGIAIYNDGEFHAAHDAWEAHWLDLEAGTDDEQLLHGLIQFTASVYHAHNGNWEGCTGLARSASEYLEELPEQYRGVAIEEFRPFLADLAADPELLERRPPIDLVHEGSVPRVADLEPEALAIAAPVLAEEWGYDEAVLEQASSYVVRDLERGRDDSRFISLLYDFAREAENRGIIYSRLSGHVERRAAKESDVEGLF